MRLLPASAYSQRINTEAVQLGPFDLPRGTGIVFTPLVTHHLPDLYPQPEKFLPDRWLTLRPSPYAYHPFGAGPRLCIGGPLATAIIRIALRANSVALSADRRAGQRHRRARGIDDARADERPCRCKSTRPTAISAAARSSAIFTSWSSSTTSPANIADGMNGANGIIVRGPA